jgi:hypothetical protein
MGNDTDPAAAGQHFSAPRGPHTKGRLEFTRGAAHLAIHGASMQDLFGAHFDQPVPSVAVDGGTVTVQYPRFSPRGWLRPGAHRGGKVTLNQDLAWRITVRGGVADLDADLRALCLEALELGQGASQVEVRLPRPLRGRGRLGGRAPGDPRRRRRQPAMTATIPLHVNLWEAVTSIVSRVGRGSDGVARARGSVAIGRCR